MAREDAGEYVCVASNGVGDEDNKTIELIVQRENLRFFMRVLMFSDICGRNKRKYLFLRYRILNGSKKILYYFFPIFFLFGFDKSISTQRYCCIRIIIVGLIRQLK